MLAYSFLLVRHISWHGTSQKKGQVKRTTLGKLLLPACLSIS